MNPVQHELIPVAQRHLAEPRERLVRVDAAVAEFFEHGFDIVLLNLSSRVELNRPRQIVETVLRVPVVESHSPAHRQRRTIFRILFESSGDP